MTRVEVENELLRLLDAELPQGLKATSMPVREEDRAKTPVGTAAVWVTYAAGRYDALTGGFVQPGTWVWAITVVARNYRSPKDRADAALDLLETVESAVVGKIVNDQYIVRVSDSLIDPPAPGLLGYELLVALDTHFRRVGE